MNSVITILAALLGVLAIAGCEKPQQSDTSGPVPQSLPTISLALGQRTFTLEVADEEQERQIGLMHRDSMPSDHGMIFVFPDEQPRSFWMLNTRIPLDIVYLDSRGKIISIRQMKPLDLTGVESGGPAKYAIELNQGMAAAAGLVKGQTVNLPPGLADSAR